MFPFPQVVEANGDFKPVVEVTRETASFSVANLRPATAYRLLITATNLKGQSRPAELSAYTVALNHPQHETPAGEPLMRRTCGCVQTGDAYFLSAPNYNTCPV